MVDLLKQNSLAETPQAALVLGGGGSARAVVYALLTAGWYVTIAARRPVIAQEIKDSFSYINQPCEVISLGLLPEYILNIKSAHQELYEKDASSERYDQCPLSLIVNTTPVGMTPDIARSIWPKDVPFPRNVFVYDLVYNPGDTALVRAARAAGLVAVNGMGMLIEQAALAFECWTGIRPSLDAMRQEVMTNIKRNK
jgi:shikimate dehydrogenase